MIISERRQLKIHRLKKSLAHYNLKPYRPHLLTVKIVYLKKFTKMIILLQTNLQTNPTFTILNQLIKWWIMIKKWKENIKSILNMKKIGHIEILSSKRILDKTLRKNTFINRLNLKRNLDTVKIKKLWRRIRKSRFNKSRFNNLKLKRKWWLRRIWRKRQNYFCS